MARISGNVFSSLAAAAILAVATRRTADWAGIVKFLRNTWYLAAWADEIQLDSILGRTIIDEPPVLFRDPSLAPFMQQTLQNAFATEDSPLIEAQQQRLGDVDFADASPVLLSIDAGPVEVRRVMERLIAAQS